MGLTLDARGGTVHPSNALEVVMTDTRLRPILVVALFLALFGLSACSSDEGTQSDKPAQPAAKGDPVFADGGFDGVTKASPQPAQPTGPAIEVVWEALAREKYLLENSRFRRRGPQPPQKIVLLSKSHPRARAVSAGRGGDDGHTAVIADRDMEAFVKGLEQRGFFKNARPQGYDSAIAGSENARGRVTVIQNGQGRSIISLRGQGQNAATKDIPRIYSEAKQAIMALRNMNPTLSVTRQGASGSARLR